MEVYINVAVRAGISFFAAVALAAAADQRRAGYDENYSSRFGAGSGPGVVREAEDLGVHWARLPVDVTRDYATNMLSPFALADNILTNYQAHGVVGYGNINPSCNASSNWPTPGQFAVMVSNLVERYDGDGVNDMPGLLYPIRVWELVNEFSSMAPTNRYPPLGQSNFIAMVMLGRQAVKSACPDAVFALDPFNTNDTLALFQQMNPTNVDLVAFHTYAPLDAPLPSMINYNYLGNLTNLMHMLGLAGVPVWATEYAFYDHVGATSTNMAGTQADNARWFVQTTAWALGLGLLEKIIYTEIEPPQDSAVFLQWMALTETNRTPRQIYYAFKKMSALIDRYSSKQTVHLGGNIYAFRFTVNSTNVYVAWSKGGSGTHTNVILTNLTGTSAQVITSVPDTSGVFSSYTAAITSGELVLSTLAEIPVYVIPGSGAATSAAPEEVASADYDGDAKADPALYNTNLTWKIKLSGGGYGLLTLVDFLGGSGYAALAADFDGDAKADPAAYDEASRTWLVKLSGGSYSPLVLSDFLGGCGYTALAADFDGDRFADPAAYQAGTWLIKLSGGGYNLSTLVDFLGADGYAALAADFDGDRLADPAIYGESSGFWVVMLSGAGYVTIALAQPLGGSGYVAALADYDGDAKADPAVKNVNSAEWIIMFSSGGYTPVSLTVPFN